MSKLSRHKIAGPIVTPKSGFGPAAWVAVWQAASAMATQNLFHDKRFDRLGRVDRFTAAIAVVAPIVALSRHATIPRRRERDQVRRVCHPVRPGTATPYARI